MARRSRRYKEILPFIKQLKHIRVAGGSQSGLIDDDLTNFAEMTSVEELNLSGNWITDAGLRHLERLKNLRSLDLGDQQEGQPRITDLGVAHLSGLTELHRLELRGSLVTAVGLEKLRGLTKLEYLGISNTPLKDAKVLDLRHFHQLRHVDAYGGDDSQSHVPEGCTVETLDSNGIVPLEFAEPTGEEHGCLVTEKDSYHCPPLASIPGGGL